MYRLFLLLGSSKAQPTKTRHTVRLGESCSTTSDCDLVADPQIICGLAGHYDYSPICPPGSSACVCLIQTMGWGTECQENYTYCLKGSNLECRKWREGYPTEQEHYILDATVECNRTGGCDCFIVEPADDSCGVSSYGGVTVCPKGMYCIGDKTSPEGGRCIRAVTELGGECDPVYLPCGEESMSGIPMDCVDNHCSIHVDLGNSCWDHNYLHCTDGTECRHSSTSGSYETDSHPLCTSTSPGDCYCAATVGAGVMCGPYGLCSSEELMTCRDNVCDYPTFMETCLSECTDNFPLVLTCLDSTCSAIVGQGGHCWADNNVTCEEGSHCRQPKNEDLEFPTWEMFETCTNTQPWNDECICVLPALKHETCGLRDDGLYACMSPYPCQFVDVDGIDTKLCYLFGKESAHCHPETNECDTGMSCVEIEDDGISRKATYPEGRCLWPSMYDDECGISAGRFCYENDTHCVEERENCLTPGECDEKTHCANEMIFDLEGLCTTSYFGVCKVVPGSSKVTPVVVASTSAVVGSCVGCCACFRYFQPDQDFVRWVKKQLVELIVGKTADNSDRLGHQQEESAVEDDMEDDIPAVIVTQPAI